jgi:RNA polymerase sigma-70 factor (ECF subfamily)
VNELIEFLQTGSPVSDARLATMYAQCDDEVRSHLLDEVALSAAGGSPYALGLLLSLITEHGLATPAIRRYFNRAGSLHDGRVDDVYQEVLIAVSRSIHRYRGDSKFTTWLYSLARNVAVNELRRTRSTVSIDSELESEPEAGRFSSRAADRQIIEQAILDLPAIFRETVYLRDVQRLTYEEIAHRQGLAVNTVRSRLSRGRALLSAQLAEGLKR